MNQAVAMAMFTGLVVFGVLAMSKEVRKRFQKHKEPREPSFWEPPENAKTIRWSRIRIGAFLGAISTIVPISVVALFRGPKWLIVGFMIAMGCGFVIHLIASLMLGVEEGRALTKR
jgi:hypothetical protein